MTIDDLESFLSAYMECALWASTDEHGDPLDYSYYLTDITQETADDMRSDCEDFITANTKDLAKLDPEQCGHDFWLTRNHHGAGFWDRGYGDVGERLTEAAHVYGSSTLYVGDDDRLYLV